ncbi:hypothetical protein BMF35_a0389 [Aurantiacibacter gangjinensis]|uniref:Uncharacterized protein n=2 Tax=Aurantiacibacter gangjinensis TaxID=502682 RepID=A0A0G9MKY1_9SPHN|nr:hypothetical protein BMF35_a0389 [Aurantiacibacter gangjinensis]KLE31342.1 hypothetical protein AAW01_06955 [Aurantiacibacter gangjinensis]
MKMVLRVLRVAHFPISLSIGVALYVFADRSIFHAALASFLAELALAVMIFALASTVPDARQASGRQSIWGRVNDGVGTVLNWIGFVVIALAVAYVWSV